MYQNGLGKTYASLGIVQVDAGENVAAREAFETALSRCEAVVAARPCVLQRQDGLFLSYASLGQLLRSAKGPVEALIAVRRARDAALPNTPVARELPRRFEEAEAEAAGKRAPR